MFMLIQKLLRDFDTREHRRAIQIFDPARLFVLSGLLQINAVARTIKRDFPLFPATLRTDSSVDRRTKAFFLAGFANCTTHFSCSPAFIMTCSFSARVQRQDRFGPSKTAIFAGHARKTAISVAFVARNMKNPLKMRLKCCFSTVAMV